MPKYASSHKMGKCGKPVKSRKNQHIRRNANMIKILFICHGNICRSPLAEFLFRDFVEKKGAGDQFEIASAATSSEEIGNPVHRGTRRILDSLGISCEGKRARKMTRKDYEDYDYLIGMDQWNIDNIMRIIRRDPEKKVHKFLEFSDHPRDIADPWYTGDFQTTYKDVCEGCQAFWDYLQRQK